MNTTLSIIIATYNSEKTVQATLTSLLNQTYKNFEVIIVDGASKDKTIDILKENESKFDALKIPYQWSSEKDAGIYDAWNKALKKVNSSWIAFIGSDDTYYPHALENYINVMDKFPDINYISSKVELINEQNKILKIIGKAFNYDQMSRYMTIGHVGSFHHIDLFNKFGNFDNDYKIAGDYEFFLRCDRFIKPGFIDKKLVRMLNGGVSNQMVNAVLKENLKLHLKYKRFSVLQCYLEFYLAHVKAIARKIKYRLL
jgi:glycosyltransferase involved in cell wall biosynthesis